MKRDTLILFFVGLLIFGGGAAVYTMSRGLRNNNPGNIRKSGESWQGLSPTQTDSAFFQFVNYTYGIRALGKVLTTYRTKYGLNTVASIISRWAPPNENNTGAYIAAVAKSVGVDPNKQLSAEHLAPLVKAIIKHENGIQPYTDAQIDGALALV